MTITATRTESATIEAPKWKQILNRKFTHQDDLNIVLIIAGIATVLDGSLTILAVVTGYAHEGNPVLAPIVNTIGIWGTMGIRVLIGLSLLAVLGWRLNKQAKVWSIVGLCIDAIALVAVCDYNSILFATRVITSWS